MGNVAKSGEKWLGVAICGYMWEIVGKVRKVGIVAKSWKKWEKVGKSWG